MENVRRRKWKFCRKSKKLVVACGGVFQIFLEIVPIEAVRRYTFGDHPDGGCTARQKQPAHFSGAEEQPITEVLPGDDRKEN